MPSKNYIGTVSFGEDSYVLRGLLNISGRKIYGSLSIEESSIILPFNAYLNASKTAFTFAATTLTSPDDNLIEISTIATSATEASDNLSSLSIESVCDVDGEEAEFILSLLADTSISTTSYTQPDTSQLTSINGVPTPIRINEVGNATDNYGSLLGLSRLVDEKNSQYIKRIRQIIRKPPGSSSKGVLNGALSELGLDTVAALEVQIRTSVGDPSQVAFVMTETECRIYEFWAPLYDQERGVAPNLEQQTDIEGMTIAQLSNWINQSAIFSSRVLTMGDEPATMLVPYINRELKTQKILKQEINTLDADAIASGSISIEFDKAFQYEVGNTPTSYGQYTIEYDAKRIVSFSTPSKELNVIFESVSKNFTVDYSPIKIVSLSKDSVQEKIFEMAEKDFYTSEANRETRQLPRDYGYKIIKRILSPSRFPQYWGE